MKKMLIIAHFDRKHVLQGPFLDGLCGVAREESDFGLRGSDLLYHATQSATEKTVQNAYHSDDGVKHVCK